jgi:hypothetical protein
VKLGSNLESTAQNQSYLLMLTSATFSIITTLMVMISQLSMPFQYPNASFLAPQKLTNEWKTGGFGLSPLS